MTQRASAFLVGWSPLKVMHGLNVVESQQLMSVSRPMDNISAMSGRRCRSAVEGLLGVIDR